MPIYEYEPDDRTCYMCDGRVEVLQSVDEAPLEYCPTCGLEVRRVVSSAAFKMAKGVTADKAASRGFTTWRKSDKGVWERVAGDGGPVQIESPET